MKLGRLYKSVLCAFFTFCAVSQQPSSGITGTVQDTAGAAVPGASIELINQPQNSSRTMNTTTEGSFVFTQLQPAVYTLVVTSPGFKKFRPTYGSMPRTACPYP